MEAELLQRDLFDFDDWTFVEMVIWRVPSPVHGSRHHDTYREPYRERRRANDVS